jgi:hypothetical protein
MDLKEFGCEYAEWIHLYQERVQQWLTLVNIVIKRSIKSGEFIDKLSGSVQWTYKWD